MKFLQPIDWRLLFIVAVIVMMGAFTVVSLTTDLANTLAAVVFTSAKLAREVVVSHIIISAGVYVLLYVIAVILCLPVLIPMSLLAGFFFGFLGLPLAVLGCGIGATLFLMFSGQRLHRLVSMPTIDKRLARFQKIYEKSSLLWVFSLRLIPILPFWVVTVAAAVLPTRLLSFFWGTVLGTIPGTFLYVWFGRGVSTIHAIDGRLRITDMITPDTSLPMIVIVGITLILAIIARRL